MPILAHITHGTVDLDFPDKKITRRDRDLDEIRQTFQRGRSRAIVPGNGFPSTAGFRVIEASEEEEVPGEIYLYQCRGVGIAGGIARQIEYTEEGEEEGWDTASAVWLTSTKNYVALGSSFAGLPQMIATSVRRRRHPDSAAHWYIEVGYKGINSNKPEKIRITMNGREVSRESLAVLFSGGWNTPQKSEILWPRVTMTKSFLRASIPSVSVPAQFFGRPSAQAPFVLEPNLTGPVDPVYHWPNGWTLVDCNHEPLAGSSITFCQETWSYNHKVTL
jgi:hypothetical protein